MDIQGTPVEWLSFLLISITGTLLAGAMLSCWWGSEGFGKEPRPLTPTNRLNRSPARPAATPLFPAFQAEGFLEMMAFSDQVLAECLQRARRRVKVLEQLDARLERRHHRTGAGKDFHRFTSGRLAGRNSVHVVGGDAEFSPGGSDPGLAGA